MVERNKNVVNRFIRNFLAKKKVGVVHGGKAQNAQMPRGLSRPTTKDWDVFVKNPKLRAMQLEKMLDKRFRGISKDSFRVKKGKTTKLKVHKVVSNTDNESVADFAIPDRIVPTKALRGVKFATLSDQKKRDLDNLTKKSTQFRRGKDLDFLRRLNKFERSRGKKF